MSTSTGQGAAGEFAGKGVLITGGASGIGLASARRFLEEGASVTIADLDGAALARAEEELASLGPVLATRCDVASVADGARIVAEAVETFGRLDVAVCNAGISSRRRILDLEEEEWDRVLRVNLKGMYATVRPIGNHMRERGEGGAIVLTASEMSLHADPEAPAYNASKGGVLLFMKSIALDLIRFGIRVNAICPGLVDTPLTEREIELSEDPEQTRAKWDAWSPIGRTSTPAEQAEGILFLASERASYSVGAALVLDGGSLAR